MTTLPTLYKKTSTGKIVDWIIAVDYNQIITTWGELGGKKQRTTDIVTAGKNIGRANATTPETQALAEAQAQWEAKLKKDYCKTEKEARAGKASELVAGGILPMLAQKFSEHGDKITWPAYIQPKLDGHRCIAIIDSDGKCTLWSRTRKQITSMPHIVEALENIAPPDTILDGELYNHVYCDRFEELTGFIRSQKPKDGYKKLQYHVYDIVSSEPYYMRLRQLRKLIPDSGIIICVDTREVDDEDAAMLEFDAFLESGYEGAILRNANGRYVNKRSHDLQKVKEFADAEFEIVDVHPGRGKLSEHGIFVCKTSTGKTFDAKMKGDIDNLKAFIKDKQKYIGKSLTVQYQGLTKNGIPRFPVALRLRVDI